MGPWFATLRPDMQIFDAIKVLESKHAAGAPVLDADGVLLGILTEKDCLRVISNSAYEDMTPGTVSDYMSTPKATVTTEMDLFAVARKFLSTNYAVLTVMENDIPVGRISRQDMLRGIQQMQREAARDKVKEVHDIDTEAKPRSITDFQELAARLLPSQLAVVMRERLHR